MADRNKSEKSEAHRHTARMHERARRQAVADLKLIHPGEYQMLFSMYLDQMKEEEGWKDLRKISAVNRPAEIDRRSGS